MISFNFYIFHVRGGKSFSKCAFIVEKA